MKFIHLPTSKKSLQPKQNSLFRSRINQNRVKFLFGLIFILCLAALIGFGAWFIVDVERNDKPLARHFNQSIQIEDTGLIHAFHQMSKQKKECGVGWKPYEQDGTCTRNLLWPSVVDPSMQSDSVSPCEDFFRYSCGAYVDDPLNVETDATFDYVQMMSERTMRSIAQHIVENVPVEESKITAFYHACLHYNTSRSQVISPSIADLLDLIDNSIKGYQDLYFVWGSLQVFQTVLPLELSFEINPLNATQLLPFVRQSGIYAEPDELSTKEHLDDVLSRVTYLTPQQPLQWAKEIVAIEQDLYDIWKMTSARNILEYIPYFDKDLVTDWNELNDTPKGFNFTEFLLGACPRRNLTQIWVNTLRERPLWVHSRYFLDMLPTVILQHSLNAWVQYTKHAILFHIFNGQAINTDFGYVKAYDVRFTLPWDRPYFFIKNNNQDPVVADDKVETKCLLLSQVYLTNLLDNYFVFQTLSKSLRAKAYEFAQNIQAEYVNHLSEIPVFKEKLEQIRFQIAVPEDWPFERSGLVISPDNYAENILAIRKYHALRSSLFYVDHITKAIPFAASKLLDLPVSGGDAFFAHQLGLIVLNAGMINPPVFSSLFDESSIYSRYGFLIAHELSHSLDSVGISFDATGSYAPWLPNEMIAEYRNTMECLIELYPKSKGRTLNEDFADQMAITISYQTFLKDASPTEDDRRNFFLSLAQMFCSNDRPAAHSQASDRVNNMVYQSNDFNMLFNCPAQNKKCKLF